jgi:hypothetical protein
MAKKKRTTFKKHKARGKPKGKPPAALRKKQRAPRAQPPAPRDVGLLDAIGEVIADVEELGQEMRDWADNMPESKQGSSKHDEVESCADTLEEQAGNDPVTPETMSFLNEIKITIQDPTPKRQGHSRSARLGHATGVLMDVIEKLDEYIGDKTGPNETIGLEVKDALEEIESNLQGVDFPGMFG